MSVCVLIASKTKMLYSLWKNGILLHHVFMACFLDLMPAELSLYPESGMQLWWCQGKKTVHRNVA